MASRRRAIVGRRLARAIRFEISFEFRVPSFELERTATETQKIDFSLRSFTLSLWERVGERACRRQAAHPRLTPPTGRGNMHEIVQGRRKAGSKLETRNSKLPIPNSKLRLRNSKLPT